LHKEEKRRTESKVRRTEEAVQKARQLSFWVNSNLGSWTYLIQVVRHKLNCVYVILKISISMQRRTASACSRKKKVCSDQTTDKTERSETFWNHNLGSYVWSWSSVQVVKMNHACMLQFLLVFVQKTKFNYWSNTIYDCT
jgi:hypothetical protein